MTQHDISIRIGSSDDNVLLAELGARTFHDTFAKDNTLEDMAIYLAETFGPEQQAKELADPATIVLIAEIEGLPAGYARLCVGTSPSTFTIPRSIEIARLYADARWIGHGVGPALMSAILAHAAEKDFDSVWLGVWEHNPRAIAFYHKWKFAIVGNQPYQLGTDIQNDFVMQRGLTPDTAEIVARKGRNE